MAERGRPTKFNESLTAIIRNLAKVKPGFTDQDVADLLGVHVRTISNWKGAQPDFLQALLDSKGVADDLVEASLFQRAVGYSHPAEKIMATKDLGVIREEYIEHYPPDTHAAEFWLRNRRPKEWGKGVQGDVNINNNPPPAEITDEQIDARIKTLLEKEAGS